MPATRNPPNLSNREQLYTEFLKEVANLYFDSINRTLDHAPKQTLLIITMYSLVGRIRMISSEGVLTSAEKVANDIVESYKRPPMTLQEFQQLWGTSDPWHEFTNACRAERSNCHRRRTFLFKEHNTAVWARKLPSAPAWMDAGRSPLWSHSS
jgi:hypothetical protein